MPSHYEAVDPGLVFYPDVIDSLPSLRETPSRTCRLRYRTELGWDRVKLLLAFQAAVSWTSVGVFVDLSRVLKSRPSVAPSDRSVLCLLMMSEPMQQMRNIQIICYDCQMSEEAGATE
jgi:hypothetical protein